MRRKQALLLAVSQGLLGGDGQLREGDRAVEQLRQRRQQQLVVARGGGHRGEDVEDVRDERLEPERGACSKIIN